ncbi:MAG TPA: magnesium/cobalt transporter CorA [Syntrophomonas sp.]|nr:magnesium/cobalt transporter CorA [Syntrophomonas sp.]
MPDNSNIPWLNQSETFHPPGTAPGTLVQRQTDCGRETRFSVISYNRDHLEESTFSTLEECWQGEQPGCLNWINIEGGCNPAILSALGKHYGFHPLSLEDVLNSGQHTKLERYEDYYFLVIYLLSAREDIFTRQVSIFWGKDYVISLEEDEEGVFALLRERIRSPKAKIREMGSDYLVYCLVDTLVDQFFPRMESLQEELTQLEDNIFTHPDKNIIARIHSLNMRLLLLAKLVWSNQELIDAMQNEEPEMSSPNMRFYLRDCYDHTVQVSRTIENYREISNGMMETHLSLLSSQQNEIIKVLTIIATIFIPLTFIVGVYGMNFNPSAGPLSMPELNWPYGYLGSWIFMIVLALGMILYFRRRHWM